MQALNITPDGSLPKNAFDLHNYEYLTSKLGQFLPVGMRETVPDADYEMSVDASTMTFPCNTAAMCQMKENYYFLFVPYSQLTNSAYAFFPNRKDNQSALDYGYLKMPYFKLGDVVDHCVQNSLNVGSINADIHGFNIYAGALRLLDLLGYGCYIDILQGFREQKISLDQLAEIKTQLNRFKPNALRIAAYQKTWYCYFRNTQYDINVSPRSFNFDDVTYTYDGSEPDYDIMAHRSLDSFVRECLQLRYVGYKKDLFTGSMPGTQFGAVSNITLADVGLMSTISGRTNMIDVNSSSDGGWNSVKHSRVSIIDGQGTYGDVTYNNDYVKTGTATSADAADLIVSPYSGLDSKAVQVRTSHYHTLSSDSTITLGNTNLFDVLQLVEAQAIQKWRQKSMLAGQRSINQYRAHYGVVPRHMEDHYPDFIGSVDNEIHISQVISQANTAPDSDESNLGDLAGRGYGASDGKTFRFHSTEHGILMLCRAIVPENLYSSYGIDRANELINYSDFWQPEFQNIGLEAVPKELVSSLVGYYSSDMEPHHDASDPIMAANQRVLGYAPRNYQLKQYPSRCHGMFNPNRTGLNLTWGNQYVPFGFSTMQAFIQARQDMVPRVTVPQGSGSVVFNTLLMNLSKYYVNPSIANSTFAFDADHYEDSDEFIHFVRFNCKAVQPLSVLGLPQF